MKILDGIAAAQAHFRDVSASGRRIGFVPTMGALHEGHLDLVRAASAESDYPVVSIFVNPLQFSPGEDFDRYPRDLEGDAARLEPLGVKAVFTAPHEEMVPPGFRTHVIQEGLFEPLCGGFRPGHFRGVATIVTKLFHIVSPSVAFFGQKDGQQCIVLKRMIDELSFDVEMRVVPTRRESDGLAMSSRNAYLDPALRARATVLYRALASARERFESGQRETAPLLEAMDDILNAEPEFRVEYRDIVDTRDLTRLDRVENRALAAIGGWLGPSRLIDNVVLGGEGLPNAGLF